MNKTLLRQHIQEFVAKIKRDPGHFREEYNQRLELVAYYGSFNPERIATMTSDDVYEYLSKLWAMLIWGNKHYVVDKILSDNGLQVFRENLSRLVWATDPFPNRWDQFRQTIKGMGPAMMSEILCKTHPDQHILWNRRAFRTEESAVRQLLELNALKLDFHWRALVYLQSQRSRQGSLRHLMIDHFNGRFAIELVNQTITLDDDGILGPISQFSLRNGTSGTYYPFNALLIDDHLLTMFGDNPPPSLFIEHAVVFCLRVNVHLISAYNILSNFG